MSQELENDKSESETELQQAVESLNEALGGLSAPFEAINHSKLEPTEWLEACADFGRRVQELHNRLGDVSGLLGLSSAMSRLEFYLMNNVGHPVTGYELFGVAGRLQWARRLRQLRTETGYRIAYSNGERSYRLQSDEIDRDRAERWRQRSEIRRLPGSAENRLLRFLQAISPYHATQDDLIYVSRISSGPRRIRELTEAGWDISSQNDDPSLPTGAYRLESLEQGPARAPSSTARRYEILTRDNHCCRDCGASPPEVRLQVHHVHHRQHGGDDSDENLRTLCSACHAGVHSMTEDQVRDELLHPSADPDRS